MIESTASVHPVEPFFEADPDRFRLSASKFFLYRQLSWNLQRGADDHMHPSVV